MDSPWVPAKLLKPKKTGGKIKEPKPMRGNEISIDVLGGPLLWFDP
jgi:hypothetical protein